MSTEAYIRQIAIQTIEKEADDIKKISSYIDENFTQAVQIIKNCTGKVVVTGIGKSAIIAKKIVATFNSTGTQSVFMHAADAVHGDLGIICHDDVVLCLSKSGNTPEIKTIIPLIRHQCNVLIAIVSSENSYLAQQADYVLRATIDKEACPLNLAPTSSTTAQLVIGDALAVCLLTLRDFTPQNFAQIHPGGSLGKQLYLHVENLVDKTRKPQVYLTETVHNAIITISCNRLGATAVVDECGTVLGIITDGDIRRMIENNTSFDSLTAQDIMIRNPKTIEAKELAASAVSLMKQHEISQLIVTHKNHYIGMVHLHDILREGIK